LEFFDEENKQDRQIISLAKFTVWKLQLLPQK